jgi:acyl-CoA thioester hydrolase
VHSPGNCTANNTVSPIQEEIELTVPFHDVDAMQVVWHGHYAKYFEIARTRLFQRLDYDHAQMQESGFLWPVVEMRTKFVQPLRYGQRLRVVAQLQEYENRLKVGYIIYDAVSGERVTEGFTVQVALDARTHELQFVSPSALIQRVERVK